MTSSTASSRTARGGFTDADDAASSTQEPAWDVTGAEAELIAFFVHLASTLGLPRSIGELFGLLYCAENPLPFEEIVSRLGISKGSASQGLRFLQGVNAVRTVHVARDRRTFYQAETSLRRLLWGLLESRVSPQLKNGEQRLNEIEGRIRSQEEEPSLASRDTLHRRLGGLQHWHLQARRFLPLIARFAAPKG